MKYGGGGSFSLNFERTGIPFDSKSHFNQSDIKQKSIFAERRDVVGYSGNDLN